MLAGSPDATPISLSELVDFIAGDPGARDTPFLLEYGATGQVASITEMYVP